MSFDLGATPGVVKRIQQGLPRDVAKAWDELKGQLRNNPRHVRPDKREIWGKAFPNIPNHRHADLPSAWRASWTIRATEGGEQVTVIFLGTHKEYDRLYGFRTS